VSWEKTNSSSPRRSFLPNYIASCDGQTYQCYLPRIDASKTADGVARQNSNCSSKVMLKRVSLPEMG